MLDSQGERTGVDFEVAMPDGVRIRGTKYSGPDDRNRLVLVHSLAMDRTFWKELIDRLPDWSIIAYDCRGHGVSDKPSGPYFIETFGDDLAVVLDHVNWNSATVAGASMGGCVALAFAARHPARARGLTLIDTTAWYGEGGPAAWAGRAEKAENEGIGSLVEFQVTRWFTDAFRAAHPQTAQSCVDVFLANDVAAYAATCRMLGQADLRHGLPALDIPVSIVVGEEDYATPLSMAQDMQRAIRRATLRVIPHARHFTPVEVPAEIAAELTQLLGRRHDAPA
jgi:3-oxoadipate enol-lactonase